MLSFVVAAVICAFAALCYAELAAMVPAAGSAYTFSYVTLGEFIAFVIGWDLVLEFTVGAAAVAVGWSAYLNATLDQIFGVTLPTAITTPFGEEGGLIILLRRWEPDRPRPFRTPLVPVLPIASILLSLYLMTQLAWETWLRFVIWMVIGLFVYFLFSRRRSVVGQARDTAGQGRG